MVVYRPTTLLVRGAFMALVLLAATLGSFHLAHAQAPGSEGGPALIPATPAPATDAKPGAGTGDNSDQGPSATRTLTVFGNGEAGAPPDIAFIDTGVVSQGSN